MKNFQVALSTAFACNATNRTLEFPLVANFKLILISKYNFLSVIKFSVMQEWNLIDTFHKWKLWPNKPASSTVKSAVINWNSTFLKKVSLLYIVFAHSFDKSLKKVWQIQRTCTTPWPREILLMSLYINCYSLHINQTVRRTPRWIREMCGQLAQPFLHTCFLQLHLM